MSKLKLFLDFDGVIVDTVFAICNLYNEDFMAYADFEPISSSKAIDTWDFNELNCADRSIIDYYFTTPRFFNKLYYMNSLVPYYMHRLSEYYDIIIVTTGKDANLCLKKSWICKAAIYSSISNMRLIDLDKYSDKSHIDMSNGVFVDDSSKNLITSNAEYKICFGDEHGWNRDWDGERITKWHDLTNKLYEYAEKKGIKNGSLN